MAHPALGLVLLRGPQILVDLRPVVNDNIRLESSGRGNECLGLPILPALALHPGLPVVIVGIGEVKPENVDFAVVGEKLRHLIPHVPGVPLHIPALIQRLGVGVKAPGVEHVHREIRMVPVDEGIVKAHLQALGPECLHILPDEIPPGGGVGALVIRILGVKHAEALVVLGGHDGVFHTGNPGHFGPLPGVVEIRVKMPEVPVIPLLGDTLPGLHPLVPGRHGIKAPVDEHAEPVMGKPGGVPGGFSRHIAGHGGSSFCVTSPVSYPAGPAPSSGFFPGTPETGMP